MSMHRLAGSVWLLLIACSLAACSSIHGPRVRNDGSTSADQPEVPCPADIQDHLKLAVSSAPWTKEAGDPDTTSKTDASSNMLVGRSVLISVSAEAGAAGLHLLSNKLSITTIGGTFAGAAGRTGSTAKEAQAVPNVHKISGTRAIDVIPGRVRVEPFITTPALRPQTLALEVLVIPGGAPLDEMVLRTVALWDAQRQPFSPDRATISLEPVQHSTIYDQVIATAALQFVVSPSRSAHEQWTCSVERRFTLVDRAATAPRLWDLRETTQARSELWLALSSPAVGSFRIIFASPGDASGFADWLRQTHASHIGPYELGMFRPGYSRESLRTLPQNHAVADTFRAVSADDLDALVVGRLGEP